MYKIVVHQRAAKYLKRLSKKQQTRIKRALFQLAEDPFKLAGVKPMVGEWDGYRRMRVGDFRIIFWVDKDERIIYVDHLGARGDVYK